MQESQVASVSRLKILIDEINFNKRSLLRALTLSLNHYQKRQRKEFIDSLSNWASNYSQSSHQSKPKIEYQVKRFCSKRTLDVGRSLMKANPESLAPEEFLWRQLKKRGLLSMTKLEQDFRLKLSRLNVPPKFFKMRETLKAMFMALVNDLNFIQRLRSFEEDCESFKYLRDKLRLDLDGTRVNLDFEFALKSIESEVAVESELIESKTQCCSKKSHHPEEGHDELRSQAFKRRKIDHGLELIVIPDKDSEELNNEETKDQVLDTRLTEETNQRQMIVVQSRPQRMSAPHSRIQCQYSSRQFSEWMSYFSKEYLMKAFRHLFTALIIYHGFQYFATDNSGFMSIPTQNERHLSMINRAITLSDSKRRLLPALMEAYTTRCVQGSHQSNSSVISWVLMTAVAIPSQKIFIVLSKLIQKFIRQLFSRRGRQ